MKDLTKREYFAAMAMQGLMSNSQNASRTIEKIAALAVMSADALMKELAKTNLKTERG